MLDPIFICLYVYMYICIYVYMFKGKYIMGDHFEHVRAT